MKSTFALFAISFLFFLTSCTKRPSPAQLNALEASLSSAQAAESQLETLQAEYSQLEGELERAQQILAENQSEYEVVKSKLEN